MLLAAFAIENLAKGILIGRDPTQFPLQPPWQGGLKTHDLVELFTQLGGTWTGEERTLIRRLSEFVWWGGRYPVPLLAKDLLGWKGDDDLVSRPDGTLETIEGEHVAPGIVYIQDPVHVNLLYWKLDELLRAEEKQRRSGQSAVGA